MPATRKAATTKATGTTETDDSLPTTDVGRSEQIVTMLGRALIHTAPTLSSPCPPPAGLRATWDGSKLTHITVAGAPATPGHTVAALFEDGTVGRGKVDDKSTATPEPLPSRSGEKLLVLQLQGASRCDCAVGIPNEPDPIQ